ncbi:Poly-beta-1,6-N-acetyl-D-glucosamine synthase [Lacunisphaera limnophila]|uniref:Poly-beta-1,6-N-acetyl-D-glucosamine synthase n=1 Tax=Lacunisphaera limnophila TaxID=1838286 RepID=A0A1D8ARY5_9BACT|nr:poly-beta-1,6-N-acetyl-D-glucosamine synthase [Lacunisphaera limnophila]AOS43632.1 Poly-beta-1,6-N-acetyl-D-glucosamine synthase [Lacunisphaera limnophila]
MNPLLESVQNFTFMYPFVMAFVWVLGGCLYYWRRERLLPPPHTEPELPALPMVSVLVPCYNEEVLVAETIAGLSALRYPNLEIIAINDGSKDRTGELLEQLRAQHPRLRVVHLAENRGKALALRTGALAARSEYLVCIDGDAILDPWCVHWMMREFLLRGNVGAVTGNPRIRNRATLLGRLQVGEFSSIVGLLKRAQMGYGRIFTVSGVVCGFRKRALADVGYWDPGQQTEDIDISWAMQTNGWRVRFAPNALCWILMPESLHGLWKQRLRWAVGGAQVFYKYLPRLFSRDVLPMWGILIDYCLSVVWALAFGMLIALWVLQISTGPEIDFGLPSPLPTLAGLLLSLVFLVQSSVSLAIDRRIEPGIFRHFIWLIWYPLAYWLLSAATTFVGFLKVTFGAKRRSGTWVSPDRGVGL